MATLPKPDNEDTEVEPMGFMELAEEYFLLEAENVVLLEIKNDAETALSELEGYTARQSYGKDSLPVEVKQALMILREALNPFDRKRIGRAALPEPLRKKIDG